MKLNRTLATVGLASLIVGTGTGIAVNEVNQIKLEDTVSKYEKKIDTLSEEKTELSIQLTARQKEVAGLKGDLETLLEENTKQKDTIEMQKVELAERQKEINRQAAEIKQIKREKVYPTVSRSQTPSKQYRTLTVEATAYIAMCAEGCIGITATGIDVRNNITHKGYNIIATDPAVIPLGSKVEINGKMYISADTGGGINGHEIDVLVASTAEARKWGRRTINVKVYQ